MTTRSTPPRFTTLLDWVDGRLDADTAAAVADQVAASDEAQETVEWIEEFRAAGAAMPLAAPPADVSAALRDAFRRHHPAAHEDPSPGAVTYDSRSEPLVGVRAGLVDELSQHLVVEGAGLEVTLSLADGADADHVDVRGSIAPLPGAARLDVVLSGGGEPDRIARVSRDGRFELDDVSRGVEELRVIGAAQTLRAPVRLSRS